MSRERSLGKRVHWQLWFAVVVFCLAAFWFSRQVLWPSATTLTHGFGAYYSASRLLSTGNISAAIYDPEYFQPLVEQDSQGRVQDIFNANPPTTALLLWPLSFLPAPQARLLWSAANIAFLAAGLGLLFRSFGRSFHEHRDWPAIFLILAYAFFFRPVIQNFTLGQAYVLIFFLLCVTTAAFTSYQPAGGVALALALLLKTTGWPLLILFFHLKKGRLLAWTIASAAVILLITLPILTLNMWPAYLRLLSQVGRSPLICVPAYQTTRSWLCHLFAPNVVWQEAETAGIVIPAAVTAAYLVLSVGTLLVLLRLARQRPVTAYIGFLCWSVLFLPLGELHHHTVILIPLVWFMVRWQEQGLVSRAMVVAAAVCYLIPFPVNDPLYQSGWQALLAYPYLAGAWLIFLGILWDHKSEILPGWERPQ